MEKIELHLHTAGLSPCAKVPVQQIASLYQKANYTAIVVTNHYMEDLFQDYYPTGSFEQKLRYYLNAVTQLQSCCTKVGIQVFLGAELNLSRYNRPQESYPVYEFLLYGLTEQFIMQHPKLYALSQEELFELCCKHNILVVQSHPFRTKTLPADARYEHGVEIFNGNMRQKNDNEIARVFAKEHALLPLSGSDFHEVGDEGRGGIYTDQSVQCINDLVECIKHRSYSLITSEL